jgi:hypothetical protein
MPDPSWPTPPRGWTFWVVEPRATRDANEAGTPRFGTPPPTRAATSTSASTISAAAVAYGTDRGSWLAGLRARAADALEAATSPGRAAELSATRGVPDSSWELDGLLTSAGRLDI